MKMDVNNSESSRPYFHEREIWSCVLGENIGYEQDGKGDSFLRPVVVVKKFNNQVCWVVPLTSKIKNHAYYYVFSFEEGDFSCAILSQMRLLDTKRLSHRMGYISKNDFVALTKKLKEMIP